MAEFGGVGGWGQGLAIGLAQGIGNFTQARYQKQQEKEKRLLALGTSLLEVASPELREIGIGIVGAVAAGESEKFDKLLGKFESEISKISEKNPEAMSTLKGLVGGGPDKAKEILAGIGGGGIPGMSGGGQEEGGAEGGAPGGGPMAALPASSPTEAGSPPMSVGAPPPGELPGGGEGGGLGGGLPGGGSSNPVQQFQQDLQTGGMFGAQQPQQQQPKQQAPLPKTSAELGTVIQERASNIHQLIRREKEAAREEVQGMFAQAAAKWRTENPLSRRQNPYEDPKEVEKAIERYEDDVDERWGPIRDKLVETQATFTALLNDPRNIAKTPEELMDMVNDTVFNESAKIQLDREREARLQKETKERIRQADERIDVMKQNANTAIQNSNLRATAQKALEGYREDLKQFRAASSSQSFSRMQLTAQAVLNRFDLTISKDPTTQGILRRDDDLSRQMRESINAIRTRIQEDLDNVLAGARIYLPESDPGEIDLGIPPDFFSSDEGVLPEVEP